MVGSRSPGNVLGQKSWDVTVVTPSVPELEERSTGTGIAKGSRVGQRNSR